MQERIEGLLSNNTFSEDSRVNWDFLKYKMKEFSRNYSVIKKRRNTAEKFELEAKLKNFSKLILSNCSEEVRKEYDKCQSKLESIYESIVNGAIIRSRINWYEKGEKSNKYFLNLEKRNKSKTHLSCLIEDNKVITDQDTILKDLKKFYSSPYTRKSLKTEKECVEFLADINIPLLSSDNQKVYGTCLMLMELYDALNGMPASKTPGNDCLTKEFCIAFF